MMIASIHIADKSKQQRLPLMCRPWISDMVTSLNRKQEVTLCLPLYNLNGGEISFIPYALTTKKWCEEAENQM